MCVRASVRVTAVTVRAIERHGRCVGKGAVMARVGHEGVGCGASTYPGISNSLLSDRFSSLRKGASAPKESGSFSNLVPRMESRESHGVKRCRQSGIKMPQFSTCSHAGGGEARPGVRVLERRTAHTDDGQVVSRCMVQCGKARRGEARRGDEAQCDR